MTWQFETHVFDELSLKEQEPGLLENKVKPSFKEDETADLSHSDLSREASDYSEDTKLINSSLIQQYSTLQKGEELSNIDSNLQVMPDKINIEISKNATNVMLSSNNTEKIPKPPNPETNKLSLPEENIDVVLQCIA